MDKSDDNMMSEFKKAISSIRDILRSPGVSITGMDSMRHICIYIVSRYLTIDKVNTYNIPEKFAWENILDMVNGKTDITAGKSRALEYYFNENEDADCLIIYYDKLFGINDINFEIKDIDAHQKILNILNPIDLNIIDKYIDVLGYVYEDHLATASGNARDLGQYFTDRSVCNYMVELCAPRLQTNGQPESICDPTMGTGGFLISALKYFKKYYNHLPVDWKTYNNLVQGCDTDSKVRAIAKMNLFIESGGVNFTSLHKHDSLYGGIHNYDVILANMPFGIKNLEYEKCSPKIKALKIQGTVVEPLFLQLIMASLNRNGRAAVVVPNGVLFNKNAKIFTQTRKLLIDNFEIKKIILMDGQFFTNTTIETSIVFFEASGKGTNNIEFVKIKKDNNVIIEEFIKNVSKSELDKNYLLYPHSYNIIENDDINTDYDLYNLKDIASYKKGKEVKRSEFDENPGEFPIIGGGKNYYDIKYNKYNYEENTITISNIGSSGEIILHKCKFFATHSVYVLTIKNEIDINIKYLYYYLNIKRYDEIKNKAYGIAQKYIRKDDLDNIKVVVPPIEIQNEIVEKVEAIQKTSDTTQILIDNLKQQLSDNLNSVYRSGYERIPLDEIVYSENGKAITSKDMNDSAPYYVMGGGKDYKGKCDRFNRDGLYISLSSVGSIGDVKMHDGKFFAANNCFTLIQKDKNILNIKYLYYYLVSKKNDMVSLSYGTAQKQLRWADINTKFKIPLPDIETQQKLVNDLENNINELNSVIDNLNKMVENTKKNQSYIIDNYLNC